MNIEVLEALSSALRERADRGGKQIGWKLGFGSEQGKHLLGIHQPLVAGLFNVGKRSSGSVIDVSRFTRPMVEPELAAWIDHSCLPDASEEEIIGSVACVVPAIELADVSFAPEDAVSVVAGNIYQENWIAGDCTEHGWRNVKGLRVLVQAGDAFWEQSDPESMTGSLSEGLVQCHRVAHAVGRGLRAGDIVLLGSVIPPQEVVNGNFSVHLGTGEGVEVQFEGASR